MVPSFSHFERSCCALGRPSMGGRTPSIEGGSDAVGGGSNKSSTVRPKALSVDGMRKRRGHILKELECFLEDVFDNGVFEETF